MTQRVPPFCIGPATGAEYCSIDGAQRLAAMIRSAWRRVGVDVETEVVPCGRDDRGRGVWTVRLPGLIAGLPVRSGE